MYILKRARFSQRICGSFKTFFLICSKISVVRRYFADFRKKDNRIGTMLHLRCFYWLVSVELMRISVGLK